MARLHLDFETRSTVDLRRTNARRYADDPTTQVLMLCYALDAGPVKWWLPADTRSFCGIAAMPDDLRDYLEDDGVTLVAHNAQFEMSIMSGAYIQPDLGFPNIPVTRWDDTAAKAARQGLPRALGDVAKVLGLPVQKDMEGRRLMLKMCKPRSYDKETGLPLWHETTEDMTRLLEYCVQDVETERLVDWELD